MTRYRFEDFILDTERRVLLREQKVISDNKRIVAALELLITSSPDEINKYTLIETLWKSREVTDASLSKLISDIRSLLGDNARQPKFIKTLWGEGFYWDFPIEKLRDDEEEQWTSNQLNGSSSRRASVMAKIRRPIPIFALLASVLLIGSIVAVNVVRQPEALKPVRVAVLPAAVEKSLQGGWTGIGVMALLNTRLYEYESLEVLAPGQVLNYLGSFDPRNATESEVNSQLFKDICGLSGCTHLVAPSLENMQGSLCLGYQIIDQDSRVYQGQVCDYELADLVWLTAEQVGKQLYLPLRTSGNELDVYQIPPEAARDFAISANDIYAGDFQDAIDRLERVLDQHPDFFWAKKGLVEAFIRKGELTHAEQALEKINLDELDDAKLALVFGLKGMILSERGRIAEAVAFHKQAASLYMKSDKKLAYAREQQNTALNLGIQGKIDEAIAMLHECMETMKNMDHFYGLGAVEYNLGEMYLDRGDFQLAEHSFRSAMENGRRAGVIKLELFAREALLNVQGTLGNLANLEQEYLMLVDSWEKLSMPEHADETRMNLAMLKYRQGDIEEAARRIDELLVRIEQTESVRSRSMTLLGAARIHIDLGNLDRVEEFLRQIPEDFVITDVDYYLVDAELAALRGDKQTAREIISKKRRILASSWTTAHESLAEEILSSDDGA